MACPTTSTPYGFALVVSSTTRPTTPPDLTGGRVIWEADTLRTLIYDGAGWICLSEPTQTQTGVTITNATIGNGSSVLNYKRSDGWIDFDYAFTFGSTSAVGTSPYFNMPMAIVNNGSQTATCWLYDVSAVARFYGVSYAVSFSPGQIGGSVDTVSGTYRQQTASGLTATVPMTWATGDGLVIFGRSQMASRYS